MPMAHRLRAIKVERDQPVGDPGGEQRATLLAQQVELVVNGPVEVGGIEPTERYRVYRRYMRTEQVAELAGVNTQLGFTLTEVQTLLELDYKIASLQAMRTSLAQLAATCTRPRTARDCPLLHSLDPAHDDEDLRP